MSRRTLQFTQDVAQDDFDEELVDDTGYEDLYAYDDNDYTEFEAEEDEEYHICF